MQREKQAQRFSVHFGSKSQVVSYYTSFLLAAMSGKRVKELRALIEGDRGEVKKVVKPMRGKENKGSVLDRIRAKEKLGDHIKRRQEATQKRTELARKQIAEVEQRVREILREQKACGATAVSRRKLCVLVEDSFHGYMEPAAVARSVDRVLAEQTGTARNDSGNGNGPVPSVVATSLLKLKLNTTTTTKN